ncbi:MAG: hypothetical protein WCA35_14275, partial [Kovacikia sp.]
MLTLVLILNGLIGLGCLLIAWQLWMLKNRFARAADILISVEKSVHRVLHGAPGYIGRGQSGTHRLRHNLKQLEPQLQRIQQMMTLLSVGVSLG